jgi:hypothetical protein
VDWRTSPVCPRLFIISVDKEEKLSSCGKLFLKSKDGIIQVTISNLVFCDDSDGFLDAVAVHGERKLSILLFFKPQYQEEYLLAHAKEQKGASVLVVIGYVITNPKLENALGPELNGA